MHKKHKLHKLHSIPIGLCNSNKYLVSYSIPLSCMVVLLLGGIVAINPSLPSKTNAITIQDEWVVQESEEEDNNTVVSENDSTDTSTNASNSTTPEDVLDSNNTANNAIHNNVGNSNNPDAGIMPSSIASSSDSTPTPSISITVTSGTGGNGGGIDQVVNAFQGGATVYRSHNVTIKGTLLKDYSLVLTGPTNLTMPSGASSTTSTVSGAGGKTGNNMATNTWGYAWGNTTDTDSNMTYNSLSTSGKPLDGVSIASDKSLNFTKKLVFAAKFGDVAPGNYTANVTLSAVATPSITMSDIATMQDMTPDICANSSDGQTATLKDSRDTNTYAIIKHSKDHKCWMQQNLQLNLTSGATIEGSKSDGTAYSWTVPANADNKNMGATTQAYSTSGTWTNDNTVVMSRAGSGTNGTYYTWCAATAGTCSGATSGGQVASASICPKGWHLPTGSTNGEFYNLFGANGINLGGTSSNTSTDYQTRFDNIKASPYMFPAAGYVNSNDSLDLEGSDGAYWSSTAYSGTDAYALYFHSSNFYPGTHYSTRYFGNSVRCVANN